MKDEFLKPRRIIYVSLFAVLTAVGSFVAVPLPFSPVPITLQTMFCILSGAVLGPVSGAFSQVVYVMLGVAGLPVFSKGGSGAGYLIGPTGGYIVGFIAGAYVAGVFTRKGRSVMGMMLGMLVIYILGIIQLQLVTDIGWIKAVLAGAVPFIPADTIKIIVAAGIYTRLEKLGFIERVR
jgi:biotin transport system substrate-specific component